MSMKVKLFEYTRRWEKEDFEKEINGVKKTPISSMKERKTKG